MSSAVVEDPRKPRTACAAVPSAVSIWPTVPSMIWAIGSTMRKTTVPGPVACGLAITPPGW